jgi:hypothetical protein
VHFYKELRLGLALRDNGLKITIAEMKFLKGVKFCARMDKIKKDTGKN